MFKNYSNKIKPYYKSREERNDFCASLINNELNDVSTILNVGSGGESFLKNVLPNKKIFDIDITGEADLIIDLDKVNKLDFESKSFDLVIALDLLEHIENFHLIFDEILRCSSKNVLISLPNPYSTTLINILRNNKQSNNSSGVYEKYYGLPFEKPIDRHRWFFCVDDLVNFIDKKKKIYKWNNHLFFSSHRWNLKKRILRLLIGERLYNNFVIPNIWVLIEK